MIRHVVMWELHQPEDAPRFKALLDTCRALVPGMVEFEVATRSTALEANVDVMLVSCFADAAALAAYQHHPHHQAVAAQLAQWRRARHVLDCTTASCAQISPALP